MARTDAFAILIARILLSAIFIWSGWGKIADIQGTGVYIATSGLPSALAWPAAIFELIFGLFILVGFQTRATALAFAAFCIVTALFFHSDWGERGEQANFFKNLAMAGGFLMLYAHPHNHYSIEALWTGEDEPSPASRAEY